jgi:predicted metalloprotease
MRPASRPAVTAPGWPTGRRSATQADVTDILRAAAAVVGDDFQRNAAGPELAPDTPTHGSSEQCVFR